MGPVELVILVVGLAVAGLAKRISGMGLPLIATAILAVYARGRLDETAFRRFIVALVVLSVLNLLWRTFVT